MIHRLKLFFKNLRSLCTHFATRSPIEIEAPQHQSTYLRSLEAVVLSHTLDYYQLSYNQTHPDHLAIIYDKFISTHPHYHIAPHLSAIKARPNYRFLSFH